MSVMIMTGGISRFGQRADASACCWRFMLALVLGARGEKRGDDFRAPPMGAALDLSNGLDRRHGRAVAAGRRQGIVDIDDPDDLGGQRDLVAPEPVRIPTPVELLVV